MRALAGISLLATLGCAHAREPSASPEPPAPRPATSGARLECPFHHADCDLAPENGCETDLTSNVEHCGHCATSCRAPGVDEALCVEGVCKITRCEAGRGDCNGRADDGCEGMICQHSHGPTCEPDCSRDGGEGYGYEF